MQKLAAREVAALDPYKFMASIGKRVIHPGGRDSTAALLGRAGITPTSRVLDLGCADEGFAHSLAIMGRVAVRPGHVRKMAWLMPRMVKAVSYLGYILVAGHKPAEIG